MGVRLSPTLVPQVSKCNETLWGNDGVVYGLIGSCFERIGQAERSIWSSMSSAVFSLGPTNTGEADGRLASVGME
jgi:hypothetical protein